MQNCNKTKHVWKKVNSETLMKSVFWSCAALTVISITFIGGFILFNGLPFFAHTNIIDFLLGEYWMPSGEIFGIFPMLVASFCGTLGAVVIGVVIGISTAIVITQILPEKPANILSKTIDLLAGIPSVIYGFFGLMVIVPLIKKYFGGISGGLSLLAVIIILSFMILPTIIRMTEVSLKAVPNEFKEAAYALGATPLQYIFKVQLRAAKSGIITGVILGIGRALGETMAVMLVAGNSPLIPESILSPVRTVTANIAMEMGYASGVHQQALFATGVVLFVIIISINVGMQFLIRRLERS
ncbi:phosphate ABC transporter permease subunit PstC [Candidatus Epulonipiscioides gigas]|nr:phosphate ABC transporter permease subunit PstC [Epulopiscium sp. SCG-C07WGA-EpuloA2]